MKKLILLLAMVYLLLPASALSDTYYLILLKNGGRLSTPRYWREGAQLYFYYLGGTVGIEKGEIDRIEKYQRDTIKKETKDDGVTTSVASGAKELPPLPLITEKAPESAKPAGANKVEEQVSIADYKNDKDRLTVELDILMERLREATRIRDNDAKEKIKEEIRKKSEQIYKITDQATEKNKGKLPAGWWGR